MTDQPVGPRERESEQGPEIASPQPDRKPGDTDEKGACALTGSGVGSDTRAGSLQGGSATGSERDEAQAASDRFLADIGPTKQAQDPPTA